MAPRMTSLSSVTLTSSHISFILPLQAAEANGNISGPIFFLGHVVIKKEQREDETVKWDQSLSL